MHTHVVRELGMERRREHVTLARGDDFAACQAAERLRRLPPTLSIEVGARMKTACKGGPSDACNGNIGLEAIDLPAEGVAPDVDVHDVDRGRSRSGRGSP